jgi:glycosyltransferase involved in cell wall biosynthesis
VIDVSVVIPVYRGERTLRTLLGELAPAHHGLVTPAGRRFRVSEVLLVWDNGPDGSDAVIRALVSELDWVRAVWLSRNFGQHAATLAGITSSTGTWVITMDEDGQHDPAYIGAMLDRALEVGAQLVYAAPSTPPPHGFLRNSASRIAKWLFVHVLSGVDVEAFNSYRLVLGEVGRGAAAYTGAGVYLDVAFSWVVARTATCPVPMRDEGRPSGAYSLRRLLAHFGRLVLSSGSRPLTFVSVTGIGFFVLGLLYATYVIVRTLAGDIQPEGWTSTIVALLVIGGLILASLGVIAQYIRAATEASLGRPLYVVVQDPIETFGTGDR